MLASQSANMKRSGQNGSGRHGFTSILLAPYNNGRPVDINDLLPECFQMERKEISQEEIKAELEALKKRLGIE